MSSQEIYSTAIVGAGAAGLTLLEELLRRNVGGEILLVDRTFDAVEEKTWCFWGEEPIYMKSLCHSWDEIEVRSRGKRFRERPSPLRYHCLRSGPVRERLLSLARESERVTMVEAVATDFEELSDSPGAVLHTESGSFRAGSIFQSVLHPPESDCSRVDNELFQHFGGWEVATPSPVFDAGAVTLMDFDIPQTHGLDFFYILPFRSDRALVEYTIFSEKPLEREVYDRAIDTYLSGRFGCAPSHCRIIRREYGVIPMNDRRVPPRWNRHTWNLGTVAGATKASTGYTFARLLRHNREIADALEKGVEPPGYRGSSYRFRVYDMMLLYLLGCEPPEAREAFHRLFEKNEMRRILKFLDERTNPLEELKIMLGMKPLPFLRSIAKMAHRIVSGA